MRDDKSEYMILKNRAYIGADDGTYEWAVKEIERLREALRDIIAIPNSEAAQGIMKVIARAALKEGKE